MIEMPESPFDEAWQARAFALAQAVISSPDDRERFRQCLIGAIGEDAEQPYWDSWVVALERFVGDG